MKIEDLIREEEVQLHRLNELINDAVKEEQLITHRIAEAEAEQAIAKNQLWADHIARFGGSWTFIGIFGVIMFAWILLNSVVLVNRPFDPYPYIFLNLVLSCLAALQAPIIMMSQNRQEEKDRQRNRNDYVINLKAEMEVRNLNSKMNLLLSERMVSLFKTQEAQLELLEKIHSRMERKD